MNDTKHRKENSQITNNNNCVQTKKGKLLQVISHNDETLFFSRNELSSTGASLKKSSTKNANKNKLSNDEQSMLIINTDRKSMSISSSWMHHESFESFNKGPTKSLSQIMREERNMKLMSSKSFRNSATDNGIIKRKKKSITALSWKQPEENLEATKSLSQIMKEEESIKLRINKSFLNTAATDVVAIKNKEKLKKTLFWKQTEQDLKDVTISLSQIMKEEESNKFLNNKRLPHNTPTIYPKEYTKIEINFILIRKLLSYFELEYSYISRFNAPFELRTPSEFCKEYLQIINFFRETMIEYKITNIKKICNPYLQLHYNLKKKLSTETYTEKLLFHGTKLENVDSICTDNFDWRLSLRHKYGQGVSFSSTPTYASHYCDDSGTMRVMFAVNVLINNECFGDFNTQVPDPLFDTTTDPEKRVYVKYDDASFNPIYVIYFKNI